MIQDRLVVGLRDAALSEKLQIDADLSSDRRAHPNFLTHLQRWRLPRRYAPSVEGHHSMDENTVRHGRQHATYARKRDTSSPSAGQRVFTQCR